MKKYAYDILYHKPVFLVQTYFLNMLLLRKLLEYIINYCIVSRISA